MFVYQVNGKWLTYEQMVKYFQAQEARRALHHRADYDRIGANKFATRYPQYNRR